MLIKTEHFSIDSFSRKILPGPTLCNILNDHIQQNLSETFRVDKIQFETANPRSENFLRLRMTIIHTDLTQKRNERRKFRQLLNLENSYSLEPPQQSLVSEILIVREDILRLFESINHDEHLKNLNICASYRVNILHLLITETIKQLIVESQISPYPPEEIEFDHVGNLSAVVVSPNQRQFQLKNTDEVANFLIKKVIQADLPLHFIYLLRLQVYNSVKKFTDYQTSPSATQMFPIFAENCFSIMTLIEGKKQLSATLVRRNLAIQDPISLAERRIFMQMLAQELSPFFILEWKNIYEKYYLIITAADQSQLTEPHISHLKEILNKYALLTQAKIQSIPFEQLLGSPTAPSYPIAKSLEDILRCSITYDLPESPMITPKGYTYDGNAIQSYLSNANTDPLTNTRLTSSQLRPNQNISEIIQYYLSNPDLDHSIFPPPQLINPKTGYFFQQPGVDENGHTREDPYQEFYPNHVLIKLIQHYQSSLSPIVFPIKRSGIKETIGANVAILCPGTGALTMEAAADELETSLPYPELDSIATDTLHMYFLSPEYARRLELGLKDHLKKIGLDPNTIHHEDFDVQKEIRTASGQVVNHHFRARISIEGESTISIFFKLCGLKDKHLSMLKHVTKEPILNALNLVLENVPLGDWEKLQREEIRQNYSKQNIMGIRAMTNSIRMSGIPRGKLKEDTTSSVSTSTNPIQQEQAYQQSQNHLLSMLPPPQNQPSSSSHQHLFFGNPSDLSDHSDQQQVKRVKFDHK